MSKPDGTLFDPPHTRRVWGPMRRGLESEVKRARERDELIPDSLLAGLRHLADALDSLDRMLRDPGTRPYDHVPLAQLQRQYDDTHALVFQAGDHDSLDDLLAQLADAETGDAPPP